MTPAQALEQAWRNHPDLPQEVEFTEAELEYLANAVLWAAILDGRRVFVRSE